MGWSAARRERPRARREDARPLAGAAPARRSFPRGTPPPPRGLRRCDRYGNPSAIGDPLEAAPRREQPEARAPAHVPGLLVGRVLRRVAGGVVVDVVVDVDLVALAPRLAGHAR